MRQDYVKGKRNHMAKSRIRGERPWGAFSLIQIEGER